MMMMMMHDGGYLSASSAEVFLNVTLQDLVSWAHTLSRFPISDSVFVFVFVNVFEPQRYLDNCEWT